MVIIARGWGSLVGLIGAGLVVLLLQALGLGERPSLVVAGLALAGFGWWLHVQSPTQHRLFWIPLQWWGVVVILAGLLGS